MTALQLAAAYRALAADGLYRQPRLLEAVEHSSGEVAVPSAPDERRVLGAEAVRAMVGMMQAAVEPGGTGVRAQVAGYTVAGKTGTAQKLDPVAGGYSAEHFVAVFAGFLPADDPRAVVVVMVDEPQTEHSGGAVAAPVFADIGEATMRHLGVPPSSEALAVAAKAEPVAAEAPAQASVVISEAGPREPAPGAMPSFIGLTARQAVERYTQAGLEIGLSLEGSGRVVRQRPLAGTAYEEGPGADSLRLVMASP